MDVRITIAIDDDVRAQLDRRMRATGNSFKETVNEALRDGLCYCQENRPKKRFKVKPFRLGLKPGLSYDKPWVLLEQVEGSDHG